MRGSIVIRTVVVAAAVVAETWSVVVGCFVVVEAVEASTFAGRSTIAATDSKMKLAIEAASHLAHGFRFISKPPYGSEAAAPNILDAPGDDGHWRCRRDSNPPLIGQSCRTRWVTAQNWFCSETSLTELQPRLQKPTP